VARPQRPAGERADVARLRRRIDALDRRIVRLLNERASLAVEIARARAAAGQGPKGRSVRDAAREREVLERVASANAGPLPDEEVLAVYRRVIAGTRRLQVAQRDGILPASARDRDREGRRQDSTRR
jgi:chorismate mutase/prephenate dehydratase